MSQRFDATTYHQRSQAETTFSMIKRRLGEAVNARTYWAQHRALLLKVISYNILLLALLIRVFYRASPADMNCMKVLHVTVAQRPAICEALLRRPCGP
jgi:hypothetical protein